jgi:hypothetical protein
MEPPGAAANSKPAVLNEEGNLLPCREKFKGGPFMKLGHLKIETFIETYL